MNYKSFIKLLALLTIEYMRRERERNERKP